MEIVSHVFCVLVCFVTEVSESGCHTAVADFELAVTVIGWGDLSCHPGFRSVQVTPFEAKIRCEGSSIETPLLIVRETMLA